MELEKLPYALTVCQVPPESGARAAGALWFAAKTDEEWSMVCETKAVPADAVRRDDGWRAFRIRGVLDFSLIGILSKLSGILADRGIGIFAVSTYNTDYILVKAENFDRALKALAEEGYTVIEKHTGRADDGLHS